MSYTKLHYFDWFISLHGYLDKIPISANYYQILKVQAPFPDHTHVYRATLSHSSFSCDKTDHRCIMHHAILVLSCYSTSLISYVFVSNFYIILISLDRAAIDFIWVIISFRMQSTWNSPLKFDHISLIFFIFTDKGNIWPRKDYFRSWHGCI